MLATDDAVAAHVQASALRFLRLPEARSHWQDLYELTLDRPPVYLGDNQWLLARRQDVLPAMKHPGAELTAIFPATRVPAINELFLGMLPFEQGSDHARLRLLTQSLFRPAVIAQLHAAVAARVDQLLYPAIFSPEGCDVQGTLGIMVPEAVTCLLLDVCREDWNQVGHWARRMYEQIGRYSQSDAEIAESTKIYEEFIAYVRTRMSGDRQELQGGVGNALLCAWRSGQLTEPQLMSYFALFLLTGLDTLTYAVANALWFLGNSPQLFAELRRSPQRIDLAFDESMRLWGPIRLCVRHLQAPTRVGTVTLAENALVFLLVHAANRDPSYIERPNELSWRRPRGQDLAFGVGAHGCLGTAIGKLVGRTLFHSLVSTCGEIRATPGLDNDRFIPSLPILGIADVRLYGTTAHNTGEPARGRF